MVMSHEERTRLFRIMKTVLHMLRDRGYVVTDDEIEITWDDFIDKYGHNMKREDLMLIKVMRNSTHQIIYVFFPDEAKVGAKTVKALLSRMKEDSVTQAILVSQQKLTPFAHNIIHEVSTKFHLEVFQEAELLVNINQHELVPTHQVLTREEKNTLLERYTVKDTQLPRIQISDPIARYHGLKRGDVVKIIRPSETAGRYVTYGFVV